MEKETKKVLDNVKCQIVEASRTMSREEKEQLYDELHNWAYGQYEEMLIEGYEDDIDLYDDDENS